MIERPFAFPKKYRLCQPAEFEHVRRRNLHAADETLVVVAAENALAHPRLGLTVSRRVGNAAVRNRWKRLIREAFRLHQDQLPGGFDLVVRPRRGAEPEFTAICRSLGALARRIEARARRTPR